MKLEWLFLVLVLLLGNPATSSVPMTNKQCVRGETCETNVDIEAGNVVCPYIKVRLLSDYKTSRNQTIISELKSYLCNREERGFCCPPASSLPMTTKQCARGETCESKVDIEAGNVVCPYIQTRLLSDYKTSRNQTIITELKSSTCNKERRGFCCPAFVDISPRNPVTTTTTTTTRSPTTCEAPAPPSSASSVSTMRVETCGGAKRLVTQIFGGQEAKGEFPFLVAFVTRMGDPFCGGVLVTRECIT